MNFTYLVESFTNLDQLGQTLIIRMGNYGTWVNHHDLIPAMVRHHGHKVSRLGITHAVLLWNLHEQAPEISKEFKHQLNYNLEKFFGRKLPIKIIMSNNTLGACDCAIEPFEILSQMLYDKYPNVHNYQQWKSNTRWCLYLVGKLRPHRYQLLKHLLKNIENLQYVMHRGSGNYVLSGDTEEELFEAWVNKTLDFYSDEVDTHELISFMKEHETPVYDHSWLEMTDETQMISSKMLETTSLSIVTETFNCHTNASFQTFLTEKTYHCIASGRPFVLYHQGPGNQYLETRGYKLYADYYTGSDVDYHLNFYSKSVQHFLQHCHEDRDEIIKINKHNQKTMRENVNAQLEQITKIIPQFENLDSQQQINMLFTNNKPLLT